MSPLRYSKLDANIVIICLVDLIFFTFLLLFNSSKKDCPFLCGHLSVYEHSLEMYNR